MKIIEMQLKDLRPYERNPRRNDSSVEAVAESIKEFGFNVPIVIDKDNIIVCGHTRFKAAKKLKLKTVPCVIKDDLTEEQIKAYRLADNKVGESSTWDIELLDTELAEIETIDMGLFGFEDPEQPPAATQEDDFDAEIPEEPKAKRGDVYQLGGHRLMCGDSTDSDDVKCLLGGDIGTMLFTSPPYSDLREYEGNKDLSVDNLAKFLFVYKDYTDIMLVNLGLQYKNHEIYPYWNRYIDIAHECGLKFLAWNVWDKQTAGSIGMQKHMFPVRHEWIFVFGNEEKETNRTWEKKEESIKRKRLVQKRRQPDGSTRYSTVGDSSKKYKHMESVVQIFPELGKIRAHHPATFPIKLPAEYIQAITDENDIVIEPFGGSGTTMIACEQLNRRCYMMELEPKYIDVIIERWETFTGKKAVKINGSQDADNRDKNAD